MRLIDADEYEKRIKPYDTEDVIDKALYNFAHEKLITTPTAQPEDWMERNKERILQAGTEEYEEIQHFMENNDMSKWKEYPSTVSTTFVHEQTFYIERKEEKNEE